MALHKSTQVDKGRKLPPLFVSLAWLETTDEALSVHNISSLGTEAVVHNVVVQTVLVHKRSTQTCQMVTIIIAQGKRFIDRIQD